MTQPDTQLDIPMEIAGRSTGGAVRHIAGSFSGRGGRVRARYPGASVTWSGINGPHGGSIQRGTSQVTPVTVGVILPLQEFYQRCAGELPSVFGD